MYVPTGNASPDFFGGRRDGLDYYSSSVVALDAATGRVVWHFQTVHHDIWDYDVPAQPVLFDLPTLTRDHTRARPADEAGASLCAEPRHRRTAVPVEERPVPQEGGRRRNPSPTQPFPVDEAFVLRPTVTEDDMWGFTPWDRGKCREHVPPLPP